MINAALVEAESTLKLGPVAMARAFGVSYATYKNWRSGRTSMPAVATRCLELLLAHPDASRMLADKESKGFAREPLDKPVHILISERKI